MIPLVAQDRRAASIAFGYVKDYLTRSPLLSGLVANVLSNAIPPEDPVRAGGEAFDLAGLHGWLATRTSARVHAVSKSTR